MTYLLVPRLRLLRLSKSSLSLPSSLSLVPKKLLHSSSVTATVIIESATSSPKKTPRARIPTVEDYKYFLGFQTRWSDNDQYAHLNNVQYIHYVDSIVNEYLIHHCSLSPTSLTSPVGLVVSSSFSYCSPLSYPSPVIAALAVEKLGKSSVTYSVALFAAKGGGGSFKGKAGGTVKAELEVDGKGEAAAFGSFVHVFVDPVGRGSVGIPEEARVALERILVPR